MVTRRRALQLGGLAIAGLAGCLGSSGESADGSTQTQTDGSTPTEGESTPTDARTTTRTATETTDPPDGKTISYEVLSPKQQAAFDDALDGPVQFSSSLPDANYDLDVADVFEVNKYVVKDGTYYRLYTEGPRIVAGGTKVFVDSVENPGNGSVVRLNESTAEGATLVREAIETDGTAKGVRVDLSESIGPGTVVEYRGEYYRIDKTYNVDFGALTLRVSEAP